ncbi:MAG: bifunctional (p)ppGpp synthetase/guanosine-3',5'-bis(diphosphate) 3'-pyrophosphohydrolase [Desulfovibrionaceae bacterium]|nr:bifunctional (p)ppGpp synthetase/guanosine-3',5'-bis(diphosphate) 3'-pyrophosphohydrolase [Desulfovibrionaceae bacterium]MBF0513216.1 bifunctional (p)ppGpp synthetase/guanosine-3',5'-bis(diphosphate) 3'-pyrophosphohydrolase [Desulfovibrionaceae bacterium]
MIRITDILDKASKYLPADDQTLIQKAYIYSAAAHAGQTRLSGEPYLLHPLETANILAELKLDGPSVAAGLLHDTVEDTKASIEDIEERFGEEVADIVDGVTKISLMTFDSKEEAQAENIRKMVIAMSEDIRVILIKLADRLHNMRTLDFQPHMKQALISRETLDIYAPLANRLGLHRVKNELEDLSLKYLKPDVYAHIETGISRHQTMGEEYIAKVIGLMKDLLEANGIKARTVGRRKHIYSIYHKMLAQDLTLEQVHDLIAFRVLVSSLKDCYASLGLVHSLWKPIPGRFKDYISMPKANMYQSLHTTVIGPDGERIEIQIRTEEMNQLCEFGVAAHWQYKERERGKKAARDVDRFTWLRQIMDWQHELKDSREFMTNLRFDLFQDEVYVFTPKGQVKELPEGATPVDFAYMIHTEVGNRCAGAKINGKLAPLATVLQNGDTVEIIADKHRSPSQDWLKFVKTAKARARIKHWVRTEERAKAISLGKEMLEKDGRRMGVNLTKAAKDGSLMVIAGEHSFGSLDDLYSALGYGKVSTRRILRELSPKTEEKFEAKEAHKAEKAEETQEKLKLKGSESIKIQGVDNVLIRFAGCCNPLPGDPIVGYVSRGRGVTIHTHDCPNVSGFEPERLLRVTWEGEKDQPYPAKIKILVKNVKGVLGRVATLLAENGVNISSGSFESTLDGKTECIFTVEVKDSSHLYHVIDRLAKIDSVIEVKRLVVTDSDSPHARGYDAPSQHG